MALQKQPVPVVLQQGVDTKSNPKTVVQGKLLELENGVFTKIGQLSKRNGYTSFTRSINASGASVSSVVGLGTRGDELVLLDGATLYTRSAALDTWVSRGQVSTCTVKERQVTRNSYVQSYSTSVTSNGITVVAWQDSRSTGIRATVLDATTGAVFQNDVSLGTGVSPKIVVFGTEFVIFWVDGANLRYRRISMGAPSVLGGSVSPIADVGALKLYDVCTAGQKLWITYGSTTPSVKFGVLDVAYTYSAFAAPVLLDIQAIGTWTDAAQRHWAFFVTTGFAVYASVRTYVGSLLVFGSGLVLPDDTFSITGIVTNDTSTLYLGTSGGIHAAALTSGGSWTTGALIFNGFCYLQSQAWQYGGKEFMMVHYDSALQATDFVLSSDGNLVGRLAYGTSGDGYRITSALAAVTNLGHGVFEVAQGRKGALQTASGTSFAAAGVSLARLTFGVAPTVVEAGENLLISGAGMQSYDGSTIAEHGFCVFPEGTTKTVTAAAGSLSAGTYSYRIIYEWTDAQGQIHRSAVSPSIAVVAALNDRVDFVIPTLRLTAKTGVRIAIFRTVANGTVYYRITSTSSPLFNDRTVSSVTYQDGAADSTITSNELLYTDGTTGQDLENDAPPASSFAITHRGRVWLGGLTEANTLAYSKTWVDGEPVSFSDFLRMQVDSRGGDVTALGSLDEKLVIFKERAVFAIAGDGPSNTGLQSDYGDPTLITSDVGCISAPSVVTTGQGLLFQSAKGFYILDRSLTVTYVGAPVEAYNGQTVTAATLVPNTNQVRFLCSSGVCLVYDYLFNQWSTFTGHEGQAATIWQGVYVYAKSDGRVFKEAPGVYTDDGSFVRLKFTTSWLSLAGLDGFQRIYRIMALGDYKSPHKMRVRLGYDFHDEYAYDSTVDVEAIIGPGVWGGGATWGSDTVWGGAFPEYGFRISPPRQKCTSIRVSIEDVQASNFGEGYSMTALVLLVGAKAGVNKVPAARSA